MYPQVCVDTDECILCSLLVNFSASTTNVASLNQAVVAALVDPASSLLDTIDLAICVLRFPLVGAAPSLAPLARSALVDFCTRVPQGAPVAVRKGLCKALSDGMYACKNSWHYSSGAIGETAAVRFIVTHVLPVAVRLPMEVGCFVASKAAEALIRVLGCGGGNTTHNEEGIVSPAQATGRRSAAYALTAWVDAARMESERSALVSSAFIKSMIETIGKLGTFITLPSASWLRALLLSVCDVKEAHALLDTLVKLLPTTSEAALGFAAAADKLDATAVLACASQAASSSGGDAAYSLRVLSGALELLGAALATGEDIISESALRQTPIAIKLLITTPSLPFLNEVCACSSTITCGTKQSNVDSCLRLLGLTGLRAIDPFVSVRRIFAVTAAVLPSSTVKKVEKEEEVVNNIEKRSFEVANEDDSASDDEKRRTFVHRNEMIHWQDLPPDMIYLIADFLAWKPPYIHPDIGSGTAAAAAIASIIASPQLDLKGTARFHGRALRRGHAEAGRDLSALGSACRAWHAAIDSAPVWRRLFESRWTLVFAQGSDGGEPKGIAVEGKELGIGFVRCAGCAPCAPGRRPLPPAQNGAHDARTHAWSHLYRSRVRAQGAAAAMNLSAHLRSLQLYSSSGLGRRSFRAPRRLESASMIMELWDVESANRGGGGGSEARVKTSSKVLDDDCARPCDVCSCASVLISRQAAEEHLREHHGFTSTKVPTKSQRMASRMRGGK